MCVSCNMNKQFSIIHNTDLWFFPSDGRAQDLVDIEVGLEVAPVTKSPVGRTDLVLVLAV